MTFAAGVNLYYAFHPRFFIGTVIALGLTCLLGWASLRAFGVGRRAAVAVPLALSIGWAGLFFVMNWTSYPDRGAAARKHRIVLRTLPVYPGLTLHDESTWGRYSGDAFDEGFINPPEELLTTWTWLLPRGASTHDVAAWYDDRLRRRGWHVHRDDFDGNTIDFVASRRGVEIELVVAPRSTAIVGGGTTTTSPARVQADAGP